MTQNEKVEKYFESELSMLPEESKDSLEVEEIKDICLKALEEIQQYREIGTAEEFKVLKEKNEPKNATFDNIYDIYICPDCGKSVGEHQNYCWNCGQAFSV
ncbi:MAG: hypothetical protein IJA10_11555 [Lachnospiraceae bacterium]|nr:hypothetical protein [Lachnospiraceae bacterium]